MPMFKVGDVVYTSIWPEYGPFVVQNIYNHLATAGTTLLLHRDGSDYVYYVTESTCRLWTHHMVDKVLNEILEEK